LATAEEKVNRVQYGDWIPGAVIRVFSKRRGVWHFGILGWTVGTVWHASKDRGLFVLTTFAEFSEAQQVTYSWIPDGYGTQHAVLERSASQAGRRYDLLNANCEDFVNWIVTGKARSPQRENAFAVTLALGLVIALLGGL
jgi:Lecithin retinol acyltransferase